MTITLLDVIMVLILLLCFILGFWNGLVRQLATILGIVAGIVVAAQLAPRFARTVTGKFIADPGTARTASYLILFVAAALAVWLAGRVVHSILKKADLAFADRCWGAGFGLLKGVVFCWAVLLAIVPMEAESFPRRQLEKGCIAPRLLVALNVVRGAFPKELRGNLERSVKRWRGRLEKEAPQIELPGRSTRRSFR